MIDLLALLAGGAVGLLLGAVVLGTRRSRPLPVAPASPGAAAPSPAPRPAADYPIRVNRPAPRSPSTPPGTTPAASGSSARLEVEGGRNVSLGRRPVTIGRGRDQALRVADERASRAHAVVRPRSRGGWELADVGSANGTQLNGHRIPDGRVAPLRDGDRIGIGGTTITYREERGGAAPPPAGPDATQVL